jgi:hypothetical protein
MDQDIAVRLANEGVPVRAIARAVQLPSADVRVGLESARQQGYLIELPCEDWPNGYPRGQRLARLAQAVGYNKSALQAAARTVFNLTPGEASILLALLSNEALVQEALLVCSANSLRAQLCRLRARLARFDLQIKTLHGYGYYMLPPHRRKAQDIILTKARGQQERKTKPHAQSLMRTKPWKREGIGRSTWYVRRRNAAAGQIAGVQNLSKTKAADPSRASG